MSHLAPYILALFEEESVDLLVVTQTC